MTQNRLQPPIREAKIKPEAGQILQDQVSNALKKRLQKIVVTGTFTPGDKHLFSLLTIPHDVEIIGNGKTIFDGENNAAHLVYIADGVKVKITGVRFTNGNTADIQSQLSLDNHPKDRLNIYRYLDGGAISMGEGSELTLEHCSFDSNYSAVCAGAISNLGGYLHVKNCRFTNNHCGDTGAAIDNLAAGSLTVIENCHFKNNLANHLGAGTFGAVTAFPDTYLVVKRSDFSQEMLTAIDYRPNKKGQSYIFIDKKTMFNAHTSEPIIKNPVSNKGAKKEILIRYARLLAHHPNLVKLQGVPRSSKTTADKHRKIFDKAIQGQGIYVE